MYLRNVQALGTWQHHHHHHHHEHKSRTCGQVIDPKSYGIHFALQYTNLLIHDPNKLDDLEGEEDDNENDDDDDDDDDDDVGSWVDSGNVDDDDDEDEDAGNERTDYDEYLDLIKQETDDTRTTVQGIQDGTETAASASDSAAASGSTSAASNDDNVFDDFTSYNDSKKKKER